MKSTGQPRESFDLRLVDVAGSNEDRPATQRLRTALKVLLRGYGFRCESVEATQKSDVPTTPTKKAKQ